MLSLEHFEPLKMALGMNSDVLCRRSVRLCYRPHRRYCRSSFGRGGDLREALPTNAIHSRTEVGAERNVSKPKFR
jgi:hypothetical protein